QNRARTTPRRHRRGTRYDCGAGAECRAESFVGRRGEVETDRDGGREAAAYRERAVGSRSRRRACGARLRRRTPRRRRGLHQGAPGGQIGGPHGASAAAPTQSTSARPVTAESLSSRVSPPLESPTRWRAEKRRSVRTEGLEPSHLSILEPKTSASTNSARFAWRHSITAPWRASRPIRIVTRARVRGRG